MFWDLLEFFKRNSRRKHLVPARGDKIPQIVGAVFGLFLGVPPLGDSPLWLDKMLGGPNGGGQPPQMVESVGRKVGPHGGTPWTREHVFSMFGGNMFSLFGGCMFCGLNFSPPSPLPPLYKEVERSSPSSLQLSHTSHA